MLKNKKHKQNTYLKLIWFWKKLRQSITTDNWNSFVHVMINRQSIELKISWKQPKIAQHLAMQRDTNLIFTFAWFLKPNMGWHMGWQIIGLADYQSKYLSFLLLVSVIFKTDLPII